MKLGVIFTLLCAVPGLAFGAPRDANNVRVGVTRMSAAAGRSPQEPHKQNTAALVETAVSGAVSATTESNTVTAAPTAKSATDGAEIVAPAGTTTPTTAASAPAAGNANCRDAYRECMDAFCLLDESEGLRCACSDNINRSKSLIQEIQQIQADADKLYTEGVEREQLGAKAKLVFGESEAAKKTSLASGVNFIEWLNSGNDDEEDGSVGEDVDIGDSLYNMASEYCADTLQACGTKSEMEEMLYQRQIIADCKSFDSYLADQKTNATANKRTAESAVRKARLEMLDTTNKYNRGECLLAYKSCISDKGGCGSHFENCLDADLLGRRSNARPNRKAFWLMPKNMPIKITAQHAWRVFRCV